MFEPGKRCAKLGRGVRFGIKYGYSVDDRNNYGSITYSISNRVFMKISEQICEIDDLQKYTITQRCLNRVNGV